MGMLFDKKFISIDYWYVGCQAGCCCSLINVGVGWLTQKFTIIYDSLNFRDIDSCCRYNIFSNAGMKYFSFQNHFSYFSSSEVIHMTFPFKILIQPLTSRPRIWSFPYITKYIQINKYEYTYLELFHWLKFFRTWWRKGLCYK